MNTFHKIKFFLRQINLKTIYFNLKYLPLKQAIKLPVFISNNVFLMKTKGKLLIDSPIKTRLVQIGYPGVGIFDHERSRTIWQVDGTVTFKGKATIGHGSKLSVGTHGHLIFGNNFVITAESSIVANQKIVEFGDDCLVSWDTLIMDTDFHQVLNEEKVQVNRPQDIKIGNHVWIGCRSLILKGSNIPNDSIIAANSVVNKVLNGENKIFGGQPAKEISKEKITWSV
jgi:carbonic anhydrase/acetyltransferase-like protein (isoleucine patch superfamily)